MFSLWLTAYSGYAYKKASDSTKTRILDKWKKRFFILSYQTLYYGDSMQDIMDNPTNFIKLSAQLSVVSNESEANSLHVVDGKGDFILRMKTDGSSDFAMWTSQIKKAILLSSAPAPVTSADVASPQPPPSLAAFPSSVPLIPPPPASSSS